jgi:Fe-S-cluster containining protein
MALLLQRLDRFLVFFGIALQFFVVFAHAVTLNANLMTTPNDAPPARKPSYDCLKCPAYCCSYDRIIVENKDLRRLAKHFGIELETARRRFTKVMEGEQVLRHQKDKVYGSVCMFLDIKTRRCTIYDARPGVCHEYPDKPHCGYYDFLKWERTHQEDEKFIPLKRG